MNNWSGKLLIPSMYECTSNQKFFVLLVSQASCLVMGQLNSSSSWDKISYGRDCRHKYSLSVCSFQEQWQLEWSNLGKEHDTFCSLMNMFLRNLKAFPSSLIFYMGSWLWSNFVWNPLFLLKLLRFKNLTIIQ